MTNIQSFMLGIYSLKKEVSNKEMKKLVRENRCLILKDNLYQSTGKDNSVYTNNEILRRKGLIFNSKKGYWSIKKNDKT